MTNKPIAMRDAFLEKIWKAMAQDKNIFFVCADFGSPVLDKIRADYPDRFANVGIAEQNLINVSAGLALEGYKVFAYAIAPFITMRCFEQIRVNLALLSQVRPLNVNLIGVGAGYSYVVSGPTHQCYEDITLMRAIYGVRVLSPADHIAAESIFDICVNNCEPKYLRFDAQVLPVVYENAPPSTSDGFVVHKNGNAVCMVATGYMLHTALKVAAEYKNQGVDIGVIDLFDLSCFSEEKLTAALTPYKGIITMEEAFCTKGGVDALILNHLARNKMMKKVLNIGVEPGYHFELGTRSELHENVGIGPLAISEKVKSFLKEIA